MDDFLLLLQKHKAKLGIIVVLLMAGFLIFNFFKNEPGQTTDEVVKVPAQPVKALEPVHDKTVSDSIMVDVKGAVKFAGVYPAKKTQRVNDVIKLAVPLKNADIQAVNLAMTLTDQMVIYIPVKGEVAAGKYEMYHQAAGHSAAQQTVNINTATEGELQEIPGIGPKKAQDILMYREQHGGFKTKEELKEIKGIGEKTYVTLEPFVEL
ncbi:helix-hairpin-helix domain-containing protein [Macrococcus equipercicus]|uniref:Helix-hairpin-helix domain-containing protein n=1 Tax=Macrococcus equipercicus TaxID=69967 RepID=A0A9Q9BU91_9STAP|nr:helix-hairpin-helix domain-containing protein [Macrococcus equipercicus]UTH12998.1 helix-hairpin-helix domain-containing protein [Macrococcus equipercicus]